MKNLNSSFVKILVGSLLILSFTGCMNMRVVAQYDSDNPVPHSVTKWNYCWGLVQPNDVKTDELCESICEVNARNNIGFILISAATVGIVVPMKVEYKCCPHIPEPGDI